MMVNIEIKEGKKGEPRRRVRFRFSADVHVIPSASSQARRTQRMRIVSPQSAEWTTHAERSLALPPRA